jgi:hypothetical protein
MTERQQKTELHLDYSKIYNIALRFCLLFFFYTSAAEALL